MIKLTKINIAAEAKARSAETLDDYKNNLLETKSPPIDYWIAGEPCFEPEVGKCLIVVRKIRNGEEIQGLFQSSKIQSIKQDGEKKVLTTSNSVYIIEPWEEV